jgi:hypothetical protein
MVGRRLELVLFVIVSAGLCFLAIQVMWVADRTQVMRTRSKHKKRCRPAICPYSCPSSLPSSLSLSLSLSLSSPSPSPLSSAFAAHSLNASILQPCEDACVSFPGIRGRDWLFAKGSWGMPRAGVWIRTFWYRLQQHRQWRCSEGEKTLHRPSHHVQWWEKRIFFGNR